MAVEFMTDVEADRLFGSDRDCQCGRCGSSMDFTDCDLCGSDGFVVYEDDDGYEIEEECEQCGGDGSWPLCLSTVEYCEANPLPGREAVERHTCEWFEVSRD